MKRLIAVGLVLAAAWGDAVGAPDSSALEASNSQLQIGFDQKSGSLAAFTELRSGFNLAGSTQRERGVWQLDCDEGKSTRVLTPAQAGRFRSERLAGEAEGWQLVWSEFAPSPGFSVIVEVRLESGRAMSRWKIRTEGPATATIRQVHFPVLPALGREAGESLVVPDWLGTELADPRQRFGDPAKPNRRLEWMYPGHLAMQFTALPRTSAPGLYLACDDASSWPKQFAWFGTTNFDLGCEIVHYPELAGGGATRWELPYHVIVGAFTGNWCRAAEIYRSWATNQPFALNSRLRNGRVPGWVTDTSAWVWNRGRSGEVLPGALALEKKLGQPVSVLWHWWHGCSYDTGFPEYLPPREGTEPFKQAVAAARKEGVRALVYMNQRLWGQWTASWTNENALRYAVKAQDGLVRPETYNTFTRAPCVSMCMGTEFWRNKYAGIAETAICDLGVGGIYMDQACLSLACFDPSHGHFAGRGRFWLNGFELLAADLRKRAAACRPAGDPIALAGEGCGESWLPSLDLMLGLQVSRERYSVGDGAETVPLFSAVYHGYAVIFGNYSSLTMPPYDDLWPKASAPAEPMKLLDRKYNRQFYLEQARAFVWGQQPTVANFLPAHLKERPEDAAFLMRLARTRMRALPWLLNGAWLQPPVLDQGTVTTDFSRLSIYAGRSGGLTSFTKPISPVLGSAWRAPDGRTAIALANVGEHKLTIPVPLDNPQYEISGRARVYRIDENGRELAGTIAPGQKRYTVKLPALSACVLEFARD